MIKSEKDNKRNISALPVFAIILSLLPFYIPIVGMISFAVICVPFAMASMESKKRNPWSLLILSFIALMLFTDNTYAIRSYIMYILPSVIFGRIVAETSEEKAKSIGNPVFFGITLYMIGVIAYGIISKYMLNVDVLWDFINSVQKNITAQYSNIPQENMKQLNSIIPGNIENIVRNMIVTLIFVQGIFYSMTTYYISTSIMKRKGSDNINGSKIREFYLPGNPIIYVGISFILVFIAGEISSNIMGNVILFNMQMIFDMLFIIQGISVCIFFIMKSAEQKGKSSVILPIGILAFLTAIGGMVLMAIIGILDSFMDFRMLKSDTRKFI